MIENIATSKKAKIRHTYDFDLPIIKDILNSPRFYELKFMPIYEYESELGLTLNA